MAILKKFKAVRPAPALAAKVAALPYDVMNSEEAREMTKGNPYSFLHVDKSEIDLPVGTDLYSPEVYAKAKENFYRFLTEGTFIQDQEAHLYIYRQIMDGRSQYGIVGCCSIEDYNQNRIKKHEHTRKDKEEDRIRHVDTTDANTGPIFLTYKSQDAINKIVAEIVKATPDYDFVSEDGITHTAWVINNNQAADTIIAEIAKIENLYIADGHHRAASAVNVGNRRKATNPNHTGNEEYNNFLAVLFPDEQLKIMDYNRVVKDLNGFSEADFFAELAKFFTVEEKGTTEYTPTKKGEIGMYFNHKWFKLNTKDGIVDLNDPVNSLDVAVLQNNILKPVLGIDDPRTSKRIDFIGGIRGLKELVRLVDSTKFQVAFAMYPTSIAELMNIADAGEVMPPKSTWFEPKLRSGLLCHLLT